MIPNSMTKRVIICGIPRSGKTTLALKMGGNVMHTDSLIGKGDWSEESRIVSDDWMAQSGDWVIEGVTALRAMRKWLKNNPQGKPCEVVYWSEEAKEPLSAGQRAMGVGHSNMWPEIKAELQRRGCEIVTF